MFESRSALASYRTLPAVDGSEGPAALRLGEEPLSQLIQLGVYPGGGPHVTASLLPILGELPASAVAATIATGHVILRISADQYWIVGGKNGLESALRQAIPVDAGCVTSLEGARTRLSVEGRSARTLLQRLVAIDLDPAAFPINGFAQTAIHHVGGLLIRVGEDRYDFFALRTYAASTWEVLLDAARPFGYQISLPETHT